MPVRDELEQPSLATRLRALIKNPRALIADPKRLMPVAAIILVLALIGIFPTGGSSGRITTDGGKDSASGLEPGQGGLEASAGAAGEAVTGTSPGAAAKRAGGTLTGGGSKVGVDIPISDTEMAVGVFIITNPGNANNAAGFGGIGQVDQKRAWETMAAEVNKNPPFGRKVKLVPYSSTEENALAKGDALWEEACAHWTRDNKVFMVWSVGPEPLRSCLTKAKVAQVGSGTGDSYAKTFKDYPWYVEHNTPAVDRLATFVVDQLWEQGYFQSCRPDSKQELSCVDGKPRIALLRYQYPSYRAGAAALKNALAKYGLALCDGCEFEATHSTTNLAEQLDDATEVQSAVLKCKGTNTATSSVPGTPPGPCTHVMFLSSLYGCRLSTFYAQAAEDQGFHPRLGLNSLDCPDFMSSYWTTNTGDQKYYNQFPASLVVSHSPDDFGIRTPAYQECRAIFEKSGETFGGADDTANSKEGQITTYCDTAWYHLAAFNAAGQNVNLDTWLTGVANTGSIKSAGTYLMRTTATRHDGAGAIRIGDWDGAAKKFKPITGDIPV